MYGQVRNITVQLLFNHIQIHGANFQFPVFTNNTQSASAAGKDGQPSTSWR